MNRSASYKINESLNDKIFLFFVYGFLLSVLVIVLYPLIYIVSSSFSSASAILSGKVWLLPVEPTLKSYEVILKNPKVWSGYYNSLLYTVFGTMINLIFTIALAYPLSRSRLSGRSIIMSLLVISILFEGGLIPTYLVVKELGLLDSRWAMLLPGALGVFQVIIARTFFQSTIPNELSEAAGIDGCNDFKFIYYVVLPLSKPIIAVLTIIYAVQHWNSYFDALIYLKSPELYPLQIILREILILSQIDLDGSDVTSMVEMMNLRDQIKFSLIVVTTVPILLIYPFVQKYFVKGVLIGSLKG